MMKLIICDDQEQRAATWKTAVETVGSVSAAYEIVVPSDEEVLDSITALRARADVARLTTEVNQHSVLFELEARAARDCIFDDADILVLDYDLFWLGIDSEDPKPQVKEFPRITGEQLSYLARCFSRCKVIVALNQFGENIFDLNLRGHGESYADINLGGKQIGNPALWGEPPRGFHPSYWPDLLNAPARQVARVEFVQKHLHDSILSALGLLDGDGLPLPDREALDFLGPEAKSKVTFSSFATSGRPRGLDKTDAPWEASALCRIAASRLAKWIERELLSGQDTLVDAPHLASRFPSILAGGEVSPSALDRTTTLGTFDFEKLNLRETHPALTGALYPHREWVSRAVWYWSRLSQDQHIAEVADPWNAEIPQYYFCEDTSRFFNAANCLGYTAEVGSSFIQRYVAGPASLSLLKGSEQELYEGEHSLSDVTYEPVDALLV